VNLTVQLTDSEDKLVATKTTAYTKDVVYPKSYYSRSNLQNDGTSSLDDFLIEVVVESQDVGGTYRATAQNVNSSQSSSSSPNRYQASNTLNPLIFTGDISSEEFNIADLNLSSLQEGYVEIKLDVTDPNGNEGQETYVDYYLIKNNIISYVGSSLNTNDIGKEHLTIFPNPTSSKVYIFNEFGLVRIYDLFGRELLQSTTKELDLSSLPNNLYLIKLEDNQGKTISTGKIIKN
jgi:hypothetical protein